MNSRVCLRPPPSLSAHVRVRACVHACVARVRACMRACVSPWHVRSALIYSVRAYSARDSACVVHAECVRSAVRSAVCVCVCRMRARVYVFHCTCYESKGPCTHAVRFMRMRSSAIHMGTHSSARPCRAVLSQRTKSWHGMPRYIHYAAVIRHTVFPCFP